MTSSSRIFVPNRALGFVSNHIPLAVRYIERRKESVIVTCVGRHFHTYGSIHFTLLNVSGEHPEEVTALAADKYLIYTACGNEVKSSKASLFYNLFHTFVNTEKRVHMHVC
jgi:U3 small nucleolar RNA-associated protein 21